MAVQTSDVDLQVIIGTECLVLEEKEEAFLIPSSHKTHLAAEKWPVASTVATIPIPLHLIPFLRDLTY